MARSCAPGMSAVVSIDTGHERHLCGPDRRLRWRPPPEVVPHRALITVCAMVATLMQALDGTIANVALPYMQGGLAATADQITWVLTSYITAAAILTAPVGFLVGRVRPARGVPRLGRRLHLGLRALRRGAVAGADGGVPAAAGCLRRRAGAA